MSKPFASSQDLEDKQEQIEEIAEGVWACTAEGDPNVGAIAMGGEYLIAVDARATPTHARGWLAQLRERTSLPVRYLVLTHYHAVRVLGAESFDALEVVAHRATQEWIEERGEADFASEARRFPRLFRDIDSVPGLTRPTLVFNDALTLCHGAREVRIQHVGRGHTAGDAIVWLPEERVVFAGDLVEADAAPYTGDAYIEEWSTRTLNALHALGARALVPGRGPVVHGDEVGAAIASTRHYLEVLLREVGKVKERGGTLREAYERAHAALEDRFGGAAIFEHCMPFNTSRAWDEIDEVAPVVWTEERDREVWDALT